MLVLVMLLSLCMTACSSTPDENETSEGESVSNNSQRKNLALTIYAITDDKTTQDALAQVEEKVSNYCRAKYKTSIDLRFYKESEYQKALDDMYAKFAEKEEAEKKAKEEAAKKAKEEAAYKATLSKEERQKYEQQKRLEAKKAKEEAEKKAKEEAALIESGKDVAKVEEVQMDIIYIPDRNAYYSFIDDGMLVNIKNNLTYTSKTITDYIFPSFMTAATVNNGIYGIPNNYGIASDETYLVINTALAKKYSVDFSSIKSITDLEAVYDKIAKNEAGVTPIYGDFGPENAVFLEGEIDLSKTVCVFTETGIGGKFTGTNIFSAVNPASTNSSAMINYFATKAKYRENGYMSDTNENFFLTVKAMDEATKAEWEAKGYTAVLYRGADFNTETALQNGLFGISKYCKEPDRAMEIIKLMYTDPDLRNLLAFGVEGVNYVVSNEDKGIVTIVDDSYSMDFFSIGNSLIGYLPDTMDEDYMEKAKQKNLNSLINPFLGFRFDTTKDANKKWLDLAKEWAEFYDPYYEQLSYGTADYQEILAQLYDELSKNPNAKFTDTYSNFLNKCEFRSQYASYVSYLADLDKVLHFDNNIIGQVG